MSNVQITHAADELLARLAEAAAADGLSISEWAGRVLCREVGLPPEKGLLRRQTVGRKPGRKPTDCKPRPAPRRKE